MPNKSSGKAERVQIIFNDIEDLLGEIEAKLICLKQQGYNTNEVTRCIENAYIQSRELNQKNPGI